jgi:hypothetical protein
LRLFYVYFRILTLRSEEIFKENINTIQSVKNNEVKTNCKK